jgi:integrase
MFLSKRGEVYYLWYTDAFGKRKKISTKSRLKSDALAFVRKFESDTDPARKKSLSFSVFIQQFQSYAKSTYEAGTCELYRLSFKAFFEIIGDCALRSITAYEIDRFKSTLAARINPVTVNIRLAKLKAALNTAKRWGLLDKNPFEGVRMVSVPETIPIHLTEIEFRTLYSSIEEEWLRDVVLFAVLTGMRRGEIVNLHWKDVDATRKTIVIQSSPTYRTKQGRRRVIPMNDQVFALLESKRAYGSDPTGLVFTLNGGKIFEDWITHKFKAYVRALLPGNAGVHFHSLRSTFATWLVQKSVSIYEVQKLLGHSSITVTQIYSHLAPNELHSTVNKIGVVL